MTVIKLIQFILFKTNLLKRATFNGRDYWRI